MMNRIDTLSSQRLWTRPAIVVEAELGDGFDNAPRRPSKMVATHPESNPETPQRFSNLLSLLPYLEQSKPLTTGNETAPSDEKLGQEIAKGDFGQTLTADGRLQQDLAQLLETKAETRK